MVKYVQRITFMLSWNEIRSRALTFSRKWEGETSEEAERQSFWNDFFDIFGISRRSVARYEERVQRLGKGDGFIDVFWPGVLIGEHKSAGANLNSAYEQASEYFEGLAESERPRYIIVSDYKKIRLYDLEAVGGISQKDFLLKELPAKIRLFGFMAGYEERVFKDEDPINVKAVQKIAKLYEALYQSHYPPELLKKLMVRLVFCFFADDSGIFPKRDMLKEYFQYFTKDDGSDFGPQLSSIFQILDTPYEQRQTTINEDIAQLPYVNGGLFAEPLSMPFFDSKMRKAVIDATEFDWGSVSPAIFGSMFQSVMDDKARHDLGAHYTSEKNILRVINPLFMDGLREELKTCGKNPQKLQVLQNKIASLKFLDPACGCGNFLVVAYRELRLLELEIISMLYATQINSGQKGLSTDILNLSKISITSMHGIEIEEFPALIAQLALWLTDHQMNVKLGELFGEYASRLPLTASGHIRQGNALTTDWNEVVKKEELSYIFGNPPFIAKQDRSPEQKGDMDRIFGSLKGAGELDYVTCWYKKAAAHIQGTNICVGFVSTNSITQGESVGILWPELLNTGIHINFAHRTFKWTNEARGNAGVYCVIIGFSLINESGKRIFDYAEVTGEPHEIPAEHINPYLIDAPDIVVSSRRKPICKVPSASFGSMPNDNGLFLFANEKEKDEFLAKVPSAIKFIRPFLSAKEYLNGELRYCLWLKDAGPEEIQKMPEVLRRVMSVKALREVSKREATKALAKTPTLFGEDRQPATDYILIPRVSSERRYFVPFAFFSVDNIAGDTCIVIANADIFHFGILQSTMHMAWMRQVCGRLESRYRYSNELVYNNFPWPENPSEEIVENIKEKAQEVLNARKQFPNATLSELYNPETMPKSLLDAHATLDRAVDKAYGVRSFENELKRLEFLFGLYQKYLASEPVKLVKPKRTKKQKQP